MAQSSVTSPAVVCGLLCFVQNKMSHVPFDALKEVVVKGFSEDEVVRAKDLIFDAASNVDVLKDMRKKTRKNSMHKKKIESDVEDILHLAYKTDRVKVSLSKYAVTDINVLPHIPMKDIDCGVVFTEDDHKRYN